MLKSEQIDKVIESLTTEEYAELFVREPILKFYNTKQGLIGQIILFSKDLSRKFKEALKNFEKFGTVDIVEGNFVTEIIIYKVEKFDKEDLKKFVKSLTM